MHKKYTSVITQLFAVSLLFAVFTSSHALLVPVSTSNELLHAIDNAQLGDAITLSPGTYRLNATVRCDNEATKSQPITVRASSPEQTLIEINTLEGFKVSAANWHFEGLDIQGVCAEHSNCEHAFHIVRRADGMQVRHSKLRDFNAAIKGNGEPIDNHYVFANDVLIEFNEFSNSTIRNTSNPVTPIDVVGGRRWIIRANYIADHAKGLGNKISYAAFLKGHSYDGIFERNLVNCEDKHTGGIRLGLSLGGGGTSPNSICEDGICSPEHQNGIIRNNIIMNCLQDVGIYLNKAMNTQIYNNILYNNSGIDARFSATSVVLKNNILSGRIKERDGGTVISKTANLEYVSAGEFFSWFINPEEANFSLRNGTEIVNKGEFIAGLTNDFCAHSRNDGMPDIGPLEYNAQNNCDTSVAGGAIDGRVTQKDDDWLLYIVPILSAIHAKKPN